MLVSVVLPTYNQARYLPRALDGVLNQTWRNYELIVVNDGSTDDTPHILEEYARRHNHITVIHQANQKLPRALNRGFQQAQGRYLTWTSSDNVMLPDMLEVLVEALARYPETGLVYADWQIINEHDEVLGNICTLDHDRHLLMRVNYVNACFLYRRECQDALGLYDPEYLHAEDWEYWWRIAQSYSLRRVPRILYQYRVHGTSLTQTHVLTQKAGQSVGYRKLAAIFRSRTWDWYLSKLKWIWLQVKLGQEPRLYLFTLVKALVYANLTSTAWASMVDTL